MLKRINTKLLLAAIIIVVGGAGAAMLIRFANTVSEPSTASLVEAVGKHYILPNEEPAIATVEDREKVSSEFLRAAENGDKLLIYKNAKKVILYRPAIDRIVEVGPVSLAPAS